MYNGNCYKCVCVVGGEGGTRDQIISLIVRSICAVCERKAFNNLEIMSE